MRLDKFLSHTGFGSRKEVKELLKKAIVEVNQQRIKDGKFTVNETVDTVTVDGEELHYQLYYYYLLHKPQGVISATVDKQHRTVIDLLAEQDHRADLFPVGRLDKDTTGLLVITNDGQFSHSLLSPKKHVPKRYWAKIQGIVTETDQAEFTKGIMLSGTEECKPAILEIIKTDLGTETSEIRVTITEGKYHQVKRMFEAVGKEVLVLHRETMGGLTLDPELSVGEYRELTEVERELLQKKEV